MRILLFARWRTDRPGGPDAVINELTRELAALGHEVTIWSPNKRISAISTPRFENGIKIIELPVFRRLPLLKRTTRTYIVEHRGEFDDALFFSVFTPLNILVARALKCPYGVVPLGGYARDSIKYRGTWRKSFFLKCFERPFLEGALFVNVWSRNEQEDVALIARVCRYVITPPGFDAASRCVRQPRQQGPGRSLLFIGRFAIQQKGLDRLVNVFSNVAGPDDQLTIAGADFRGGLADLEARIAASPAKDRIRIVGPAWGEEKARLFQAHDAFIHLSRWEGLPLALVEAMAYGMPVIISSKTNAGDYVRDYDAGWVAEGNDFDFALRSALSSTAAELDRIGANAARLVANEFRWDKAALRLEQAFLNETQT